MKKWTNLLFCAVFLLSLSLPLLSMDVRKNQESEIDNAFLPEFPTELNDAVIENLENYISKRIGFRAEALNLYQKLNDQIFGLMEHPTYMYGSDGHVFFKANAKIQNFQHLNLDQEDAERFAQALSGFQDYAEEQGKLFLYWLLPDKETVYPEYYPDTINVYGDLSYTDQILTALSQNGVRHHFAKNAMVEGKKQFLVNNVKYDAGHWNDHGAFVSCLDLYTLLQQDFPNIIPPKAEDYIVEQILKPSLDTSHFEINENVPYYVLKEVHSENHSNCFDEDVFLSAKNDYASHYINPDCANQPSILFFGDSYLRTNHKFFTEKFSQTTFIHRYNCLNQDAFEYYVDYFDPDIIIFENPERSLPIDLYQEFEKP